MGHFTTIKGIKVDARVFFDYHADWDKIDAETFICAVGKFLKDWGRYSKEWQISPQVNDYDDPIIRFSAEMEDVPALSFDKGCTDFIRNADNWVREPSAFDKWYFNANIGLTSELACFFWDELAKHCGIAEPEKVSFSQAGFECDCGGVYVSEMCGYVPTEDTPISDYNEEETL